MPPGQKRTDICEHGRQRYYCKECGGKGICEHGRKRSECKECGGKGICEHGRERRRCKECKGIPSIPGSKRKRVAVSSSDECCYCLDTLDDRHCAAALMRPRFP